MNDEYKDGEPPAQDRSNEPQPEYDRCWFWKADLDDGLTEFGYCENPDCVDPKADPAERRAQNLPTGRFWGASTKSVLCTCGKEVGLT